MPRADTRLVVNSDPSRRKTRSKTQIRRVPRRDLEGSVIWKRLSPIPQIRRVPQGDLEGCQLEECGRALQRGKVGSQPPEGRGRAPWIFGGAWPLAMACRRLWKVTVILLNGTSWPEPCRMLFVDRFTRFKNGDWLWFLYLVHTLPQLPLDAVVRVS